MATKKIQISRKENDGTLSVIHPETQAEVVEYTAASSSDWSNIGFSNVPDKVSDAIDDITSKTSDIVDELKNLSTEASKITYSNTTSKLTSTNVQGAIDEVVGDINVVSSEVSTVSSNLSTHTSSTNNPHKVTATQVGLGNVTNDKQVKGLSTGSTADHIVVWGADGYTVKDGGKTVSDIVEIAEGKTKAYAVDCTTQTVFKSTASSITAPDSFTTIGGETVNKSDLKTGDIVYIIQEGYPDRWYSSTDSKFYKMESTVVDLTEYQTKTMGASVKVNGTTQTTVEGAISSLATYTDTLSNNISTNADNISTLNTTVSGLSTKVDTLTTDLKTTNTSVSNIINGTTQVGNAATLEGHNSKYYTDLIDSATAEAKKHTTVTQSSNNGYVSVSTNGGTASDVKVYTHPSYTAIGTYSIVQTDSLGHVTAGGNIIEWGTEASSSLVAGGILMKEI